MPPMLRLEPLECRWVPARLNIISRPTFDTTDWATGTPDTLQFSDDGFFYELDVRASPPIEHTLNDLPRNREGSFSADGSLQVRISPTEGESFGDRVRLEIDYFTEVFWDRNPVGPGGPETLGTSLDFSNSVSARLSLGDDTLADLSGGHTPTDPSDFEAREVVQDVNDRRVIFASIGDVIRLDFAAQGASTGSWLGDNGDAFGEAGVYFNVLMGVAPAEDDPGNGQPVPDGPAYAVGSGAGVIGQVNVYDASGREQFRLFPFGGSYTLGVRVAVADVNGDGTQDVVTAAGPGGAPLVKVYDGQTRQEIMSFLAYEDTFLGGVFVSAGDLNNDGLAEIVTSPDVGGGPRIRVFQGNDPSIILADFFGIEDPNFRGGVRLGIGDLSGDGQSDLVVGAGFGGGPRVAGFDGPSLLNAGNAPAKLFADFFVFEPGLRNGVFLSVGDLDGDGRPDLIAGAGPGGGPRMFAIDGPALMSTAEPQIVQRANFFAGNVETRGGIRVVTKNLDGDNRADLVVGPGEGSPTEINIYAGRDVPSEGIPTALDTFTVFNPSIPAGVFVG